VENSQKIKFDLSFKFKGNRKYVAGTDVYNKVVEKLLELSITGIRDIELSFHRFIHHNLSCNLSKSSMDIQFDESSAIFTFKSDGLKYFLALVETKDEVKGNYNFDEYQITGHSLILKKTVELNQATNICYSNIEKVVALNKHLLNNYFSENTGKWAFSKIQLVKEFKTLKPSRIRLMLEKNIGLKLTKSAIDFDGNKIGYIYFSAL